MTNADFPAPFSDLYAGLRAPAGTGESLDSIIARAERSVAPDYSPAPASLGAVPAAGLS